MFRQFAIHSQFRCNSHYKCSDKLQSSHYSVDITISNVQTSGNTLTIPSLFSFQMLRRVAILSKCRCYFHYKCSDDVQDSHYSVAISISNVQMSCNPLIIPLLFSLYVFRQVASLSQYRCYFHFKCSDELTASHYP